MDTKGTWAVTGPADAAGRLHLSLRTDSTAWSEPVTREELRGLGDDALASPTSTPASFRVEREAGVFAMEGSFEGGKGSGRFVFHPGRAFAPALRAHGVADADALTDRDLMTLAQTGASSAAIGELAALVGPLEVRSVMQLVVHGVTPDYVRTMRALGVGGTETVAGAVELRIHGVTAEYVRELEEAGYPGLSREQLLEMGIHGVRGDEIRALLAAGVPRLPPRELVNLRIHGVTAAFVRQMGEAGLDGLTPQALVDLRIHGVTAEYVRELGALGYSGLTRRQLMEMGIHGVTPAFIRALREKGISGVSPEKLVEMKIHGTHPPLPVGRLVRTVKVRTPSVPEA
ncbi:MAG TPA: hypothetical protein VF006_19500 [Longimicrobium sp.]